MRLRWLLPILLGVLAMALLAWITHPFGIAFGADTIAFLSTAQNVASGDLLFAAFGGFPLIRQPPLYPALIAILLKLTGGDALTLARWVNIVLYGATIGLSSWLLGRSTRSTPLFVLGSLALAVSLALFDVHLEALTEPLFILIVVLFLGSLVHYLNTRSRRSLIILAMITGLGLLTRYAGHTLVWVALISIACSDQPRGDRVRAALNFVLITALMIGGWLLRNYMISTAIWGTDLRLSDALFGQRAPSIYPLGFNIERTFVTLYAWFLPESLAESYVLITAGLLLLLAIVTWLLFRSHAPLAPAAHFWRRVGDGLGVRGIVMRLHPLGRTAGLLTLIYLLAQISASTSTALTPIATRYLSPIAAPLILFVVLSLDALTRAVPSRRVHLAAAAACALLIAHPLIRIPTLIPPLLTEGPGDFNIPQWRNSETLAYVREGRLTESYSVYTNLDTLVYFVGKIDGPRPVPSKLAYGDTDEVVSSIAEHRGVWPSESPAYLVWFDANESYYFTLDEMHQIAHLRLIEDLSDGAIYEVRRRDP